MGDLGLILSWKDPLEKQMVTQSRILAWRIPWIEEPGGYSPWGHKESDMTEWLTFRVLETTAKQQDMFKSLMIKEMQKKWDFTSHILAQQRLESWIKPSIAGDLRNPQETTTTSKKCWQGSHLIQPFWRAIKYYLVKLSTAQRFYSMYIYIPEKYIHTQSKDTLMVVLFPHNLER